MSVALSTLGTQPIGETSRVSDGVYQVKLPVPFLKFVASYLVEDRDGWTVIDPGFDYPPARGTWRPAPQRGLDLERDLRRIIVTHLHPDHMGSPAGWKSGAGRRSGCSRRDRDRPSRLGPEQGTEDFVRYLIRNGMDAQTAEPTAGSTKLGVRLPERLIPLRPGDAIELGGGEARVVHTPGHSDFHFVLHDERRRLLFAGDHLLLKITPNIGLWTYTAPRPLRRYLESLQGLRPWRGPRLPGARPALSRPGRAHRRAPRAPRGAPLGNARSPGREAGDPEVARRVFPEDLTDHQLRFALAETLAHLEHLEGEGYVEQVAGGGQLSGGLTPCWRTKRNTRGS